jgi:hypothetical protein
VHALIVLQEMKSIALLLLLTVAILRGDHLRDAPWPPKDVDFIVAYCYDFTQDPRGGSPVFPDGSLHKGIIQSATVRLNQQQQERLFKTITSTIEFEDSEDCHYPHHAFVFYDASRKPVGWISVCLECGNYYFSSKNAPEYVPMREFSALCADLKMPRFYESDDYTKLFRQEQPEAARAAVKSWKETLEAEAKAFQNEMEGDDPFVPEKDAEQGGAGEPATRSESDSEGGDKPQPEAEGRPR